MTGASELGDTINERRLSLHYSIGQLANVVGVTASEVRTWENGDKVPDAAEVAKLAEALGMKQKELERLVPAAPPEPETSDVPEATAVVAAPVKPKQAAAAPPVVEEAEPEAEADERQGPEPSAGDETPAESDEEPAEEEHGEVDESPLSKVAPPQSVVGEQIDESDAAPSESVADEPPAGEGAGITDLPTERIPIIADAPPPPERERPQPAVAVATAPPPRPAPTGPAPAAGTLTSPWRQTMETIFDRDKPWLFWIRTGLLLVSMLILLRILAWAVPEFFTALGDILDTIQSTNPDPELEDPIPIGP